MGKERKKRRYLIDEYRGFVVLNMIAYHATWDLVYLFNVKWDWYRSQIGFVWQQWICWSFILISGFCWQMGKKHLKRGLLVLGAGALVSLVTILVMPQSRIVYGVLTFMGSAMLLMIPCDLICKKISPVLGGIGSFLLFLMTYSINDGYLTLGNRHMYLPSEWYANTYTTYLGFVEKGFFSTDYFSIFPWFFLFVTGYFLYFCLLKAQKENTNGQKSWAGVIENILCVSICPPLGWIGRHALIIYMLHQPAIYVLLSIWNMLR